MMTVEKMIAWLRDNDTPDDHETRLQIADEFEKHVNSLVISGGMYRSKQAELETALLRLDALQKERDAIMRSHLSIEEILIARERERDEALDRLDQVRLALANPHGLTLDYIRKVVGEKLIVESNPGLPPDPRERVVERQES